MKKKFGKGILAVWLFINCFSITSFAEGEDASGDAAASVTKPIFTIINIFVTAMQAVGAFIFIKGIVDLSTSIKQQDDTGIASAVKGMIAGLLLIMIRTILSVCGVQLS